MSAQVKLFITKNLEDSKLGKILKYICSTGCGFMLSIASVMADEVLMPFVLASTSSGEVASVTSEVKPKLTASGFEIVGEYSPYDGAHVVVVTSDSMKAYAAKSNFGAYGAIARVSITRNGDVTEVTYTNPEYTAAAYRMAVDMADIRAQLEGALGAEKDFGSEKKLTAEKLRKYHYKFAMPYFDDQSELAKYASQAEAVKAIEDALAAGKGATAKVYRVDIPGKDETIFGVALKGKDGEDCSADQYIMGKIDNSSPRHTAHLPYEIVVSDGVPHALSAKFRIAINWPHLSMMGEGSFMSIMCAPDAIEKALVKASGK
jgi:hypothetical protein